MHSFPAVAPASARTRDAPALRVTGIARSGRIGFCKLHLLHKCHGLTLMLNCARRRRPSPADRRTPTRGYPSFSLRKKSAYRMP